MSKITHLLSLSLLLSPLVHAQAEKGDELMEKEQFAEAIKAYDKAITDAKSDTAEQILKKHKMLSSKGWAHFRNGQKELSEQTLDQRYELIVAAAKRFPNNFSIIQLQVRDIGSIARRYIRTEKAVALHLQAVAIADDYALKHAKNNEAKLMQINARFFLAKAYRWNNTLRLNAIETVDEALKIHALLDASAFPANMPKPRFALELLSIKVATLSLSKKYDQALKVSTELLKYKQPLLDDQSLKPYDYDYLFNSMYQHALLHEKLDQPENAQLHLKELLKTFDLIIERYPDNSTLKRFKKMYSKWLGKKLR